jgi:hypothetical protein
MKDITLKATSLVDNISERNLKKMHSLIKIHHSVLNRKIVFYDNEFTLLGYVIKKNKRSHNETEKLLLLKCIDTLLDNGASLNILQKFQTFPDQNIKEHSILYLALGRQSLLDHLINKGARFLSQEVAELSNIPNMLPFVQKYEITILEKEVVKTEKKAKLIKI